MRETTNHRTSPLQSYKQIPIYPPESKTMLTQQGLLPNATKEPKHTATSKEQSRWTKTNFNVQLRQKNRNSQI